MMMLEEEDEDPKDVLRVFSFYCMLLSLSHKVITRFFIYTQPILKSIKMIYCEVKKVRKKFYDLVN